MVFLRRPAFTGVVVVRALFGPRPMSEVEAKVLGHFIDDVHRNALQLPGVGGDQGVFANRIDQARNTPRLAIDFSD